MKAAQASAPTAEGRLYHKKHREDEWFDEVLIEGPSGPLLRCVIAERWKSSYLSGDEWRFSYYWSRREEGEWVRIEGASTFGLRYALEKLYPVVCEHLEAFFDLPVSVHFYRKGYLAWNAEVRTLRDAAGHLPWDLVVAGEQHDAIAAEKATDHLCAQPGCQSEATVTYRIIQEYDHCGHKQDTLMGIRYKRCFCEQHKRRGDCALEDADSNYEPL